MAVKARAWSGLNPSWPASTTLKPQPDNTIFYPVTGQVTRDNLDQVLAQMQDKPDSYFLAEWFSEPQLDALFA